MSQPEGGGLRLAIPLLSLSDRLEAGQHAGPQPHPEVVPPAPSES